MPIKHLRLHAIRMPRIYRTYVAADRGATSGPVAGKDGSLYYILEITDGSGHTGLGEISDMEDAWQAPGTADLAARLEPLVVGTDLLQRRQLAHKVRAAVVDLHPELARMVATAVEMAVLDLTARSAGLPLSELLGGRCRDRVATTWVAYIRGVDDLEQEMSTRLQDGFRAFKLKVGSDHSLDCDRVRLARRLAGPHVHLRLDASGSWQTKNEAVDAIARFAELGAHAVETPLACVARSIAKDDPGQVNADPAAIAEALRELRAVSPLPLIEHVADFDDAFTIELVARRAVDAINVVPVQAGGLLRAQRLLQVAEAAGMAALLGSTVELGIGTAAAVHLACACSAVTWASDLVGPGLLAGDVVRPGFHYEGGGLGLPDASRHGLGVELDAELMAQHAVPT